MSTLAGKYDTSVEMMHTYAPDTVTPFTGWRREDTAELPVFTPPTAVQKRVAQIAISLSEQPFVLTLIDDVVAADVSRRSGERHPDSASLMSEFSALETLDHLHKAGQLPDYEVYYESTYEPLAYLMREDLRIADLPSGYRFSRDGRAIVAGRGRNKSRISLAGFRGVADPDYPSCEMFDLAWVLDRLESVAPRAVNILPDSYRGQQTRVATLAGILAAFRGYEVITIFVDEQGQETSRMVWPLPSTVDAS